MIKDVQLMLFDAKDRQFAFFKTMDLAAVPGRGDKIVTDVEDLGQVYKVHDTHFTDHGGLEVNVIHSASITDYYSSGYPDIV